MKTVLACGMALGAVLGWSAGASAATANIWGEEITLRWHVGNFSIWQSTTFTAVEPGVDFTKASPGSPNWMVTGDTLDVTLSGNPAAP